MRLAVIFTLAYAVSPYLAEHRPHIVISWIVFAVFLFAGIGIDKYISYRMEVANRP
jgi:hypothetical protein